jgi:carboxymethylenebutenolidase
MAEFVAIPSPGETVYFGEAGHPLVVVVHDWYGRLPGLLKFSEALTHAGYRVAVPDLYGGLCSVDDDGAQELMDKLDVRGALALIDDIIASARAEGSQKVGIVGFSMGGWLTLLHAQGGSADAVVAYYATLGEGDHGLIPSPVLLQFAEEDEWDADSDPASFIARLTEHGTPVTEHTYVGTVHSFANATIPAKFDARAAALAFARTASFLDKHLVD